MNETLKAASGLGGLFLFHIIDLFQIYSPARTAYISLGNTPFRTGEKFARFPPGHA
jgi:hypothetical protein